LGGGEGGTEENREDEGDGKNEGGGGAIGWRLHGMRDQIKGMTLKLET
jgi:hypothetical protein